IAAIGLLALTHSARFQNTWVILIWNLDVNWEPLAVVIELRPPRKTLIKRTGQRLVAIGQIDAAKNSITSGSIALKAHRRRIGEAGTELDAVIIREIEISI